MTEIRRVLLAIDERDERSVAVDWAAAEAEARRVPLLVVHAYSWPPAGNLTIAVPHLGPEAWEQEKHAAQALVDRALEQLRYAWPNLEVSAVAAAGQPNAVILAHADASTLIVVGSRELSGVGAHLLGSVGQHLTSSAPGPVLVVRPSSGSELSSRPVAVAINLAQPAPEALEFAVGQARARHRDLAVVGYWRPASDAERNETATAFFDPQAASAELDRQIAPWLTSAPELNIRADLSPDSPATNLVDGAANYSTLVVERSEAGPLARSLLGSVSSAALQHSARPVTVVPVHPISAHPAGAPASLGEGAKRPALAEQFERTVPLAGPVVLGVNGSEESDAVAIEWAADEAHRRRCEVRVVAAYDWAVSMITTESDAGEDDSGIERLRGIADTAAAHADTAITRRHPEVTVSRRVVQGEPADVLVAESAEAAIVVIGSRRLRSVGSFLLGSVGAEVSCHARCPTVVIRGTGGLEGESAPVIVGIDGTAESQAVLAFGFDEASYRQRPLHVIHAWNLGVRRASPWREKAAAALAEQAELAVAEALAGWQEKYPDVEVTHAVVQGHPSSVLVEVALAPELLVVGNRARSPVVGAALGRVNLSVLHHATCPVAVVPLRA